MRFTKYFSGILIARGVIRWFMGQPIDLLWTLTSQSARRRHAKPSRTRRSWYPPD
jgi:hypothetical protein